MRWTVKTLVLVDDLKREQQTWSKRILQFGSTNVSHTFSVAGVLGQDRVY